MSHTRSGFIRLIVCCGLIVLMITPSFASSPPSTPDAEPSTPEVERMIPLDTPITVVADSVEEWTVGNGLIYWAYSCFADEFVSTAALKRKPVAGGTQRTLESINDGNRCITFLSQHSSSDGLLYYDDSQGRIERTPLDAPYTPQVVKPVSGDQKPSYFKSLVEADGYLYWIGFQQIVRTLKNGSGALETVVSTTTLVSDVLVVGSTVYWVDSSGVWSISVNCAALPCNDTRSQFAPFGANTNGHGLMYQYNGGVFQNYSLYWVQRTTTSGTSTYQIKGRSCNQIVNCTLITPFTFYTATANWFIGNPVIANNTLYWTERDTSISTPTGDIKRKSRTAASSDPAETIATNQANLDRRLFVANNTLFFARTNTGIYSLPLGATAIVRDFIADGLEVTQAIQNLANSAPLVAAKTTYVRAYSRQLSGPNTPNVEARLIGTRNGTPLAGSPLSPVNGVRALVTGGSFDRARLGDGWYFLLPANWISAGTITIRLDIDGRQIHTDPDRSNNSLSTTVTFQSKPPICVWTVPVRTNTPQPSTNDPNFWSMVDHFKRRWPAPDVWIYRDTSPVEELEVSWWGPFPYPSYGPYELEDGWSITNGPPDRDKVILSLWARALLSFNPQACDNQGAPVHFMGMVHPEANNGGASGYASTISNQSWVQLPDHTPNPVPPGWNMLREGSVMAQELAHNYGRKHINCGNPSDVDTNYPYPPCQIANTGAESYYGFDVTTRQPIRPDQTADFMTYANRSWVSDYTWRALMNSFVTAKPPPTAPVAAAGNSVFVTGLVDQENSRGAFGTVLVLPAESVPPATRQALHDSAATINSNPAVAYRLRLLDGAGTVLVERPLILTTLDDHYDGASAVFNDLFPAPAGDVASIQLLADSTVIATIQPGATAPVVSIEQPTSGTTIDDSMQIQWRASDADPQDRLLFTVQYSYNGGTQWHTLISDYPSTPAGVYTLTLDDLGGIAGSSLNGARIRVLASDGYHTSIATSQPFTVVNRPPEPAIIVPTTNQIFAAGEAIVLRGQATDPEDGGLANSALAWSIDGSASGNGSDLSVAGLAPGTHTAVLNATDSASKNASARTSFRIAPLNLPQSAAAPLLNGFCDDSVYGAAQVIQLEPYGDGSQASVRLVRSADQLWACFSGLKQGPPTPGSLVGLRIDRNHSRDAQAQSDDYGFFVGEDGDVFTQAGDGAGGFANAGPGGLQAQVSTDATGWSAELRIDQTILGGWNHLIGMNAGHYRVDATGNEYTWPYAASAAPSTWATTVLGMQPVLMALDPATASVQDSAFTLNVYGSSIVSGTVVLWGGVALPTTFIDSEQLTAQVSADQLNNAGEVTVTLRTLDGLESNATTFQIQALAPTITSLSPTSIKAGSATTTLIVNGANFGPDAQVLFNGTPLPTQVVDATQLRVQLTATLLAQGQTVGIAVRNQTPNERISKSLALEIQPQSTRQIYLPLVLR